MTASVLLRMGVLNSDTKSNSQVASLQNFQAITMYTNSPEGPIECSSVGLPGRTTSSTHFTCSSLEQCA